MLNHGVQQLGMVDLCHRKFCFSNNNKRPFRATNEDTARAFLIPCRLKFLSSIGLGRWTREKSCNPDHLFSRAHIYQEEGTTEQMSNQEART